MARWNAQAAPLRGVAVVSQHKAYAYLYDWLGIKEVAVLEPKPGVEPSAAHLQQVLDTLKGSPARMTVFSAYQDPKAADWLSRNAGVPAVKIPFTVGGTEGARDLFGLFDDLAAMGARSVLNRRRPLRREPWQPDQGHSTGTPLPLRLHAPGSGKARRGSPMIPA